MSRTVYEVRVAGARGPGLSAEDIAAFEALVDDAEAAQTGAEEARDAAVAAANSAIPRLGIEGDSIMARNHSTVFGTDGAATQGLGEFTWLRAIYPYFEMDQWHDGAHSPTYLNGMNSAVSGNTTADLISRLDTVSDLAEDVRAIAIGVNDIGAGTAEATILANIQTICRFYSGLGRKVLLGGVRPVAASVHAEWADGGVRTLKRIALNADLAAWAATEPNVFFVDLDAGIGDGANPVRPLTGTTSDGLHLTRYGAWLSAQVWLAALRKVIKPLVIDTPTGTNVVTNGSFTGSGGSAGTGASGTVAQFWAVSRNLGAASVACTVTSEGQVLTITPGGVADEQIQVARAAGGTPLVEGTWYKAFARITLSASEYWRGIYWTPWSGSTGAASCVDTMSGAVLTLAEDTEFIFETPAFEGPVGGTTGTILLRIMLDGASPSPMVATVHEICVAAVPDPRPLHGF